MAVSQTLSGPCPVAWGRYVKVIMSPFCIRWCILSKNMRSKDLQLETLLRASLILPIEEWSSENHFSWRRRTEKNKYRFELDLIYPHVLQPLARHKIPNDDRSEFAVRNWEHMIIWSCMIISRWEVDPVGAVIRTVTERRALIYFKLKQVGLHLSTQVFSHG